MKNVLVICAFILAVACNSYKKQLRFNTKAKEHDKLLAQQHAIDSAEIAKRQKLNELPRVVDLSPFQTPVKDQNVRATCGYFAFCGMLESYYKLKFGIDLDLSEEYLIGHAQKNVYGIKEASCISNPIKSFEDFGVVKEETWPYQPSWFLKGFPYHKYGREEKLPDYALQTFAPPKEIISEFYIDTSSDLNRGFMRAGMGSYFVRATLAKDSFTIIAALPMVQDEFRHYRRNETKPYKVTFSDARNIFYGTGEFTYDTANVFKIVENDTIFIGKQQEEEWKNHFVLLTGYDIEKQLYYFKNSWGTGFGNEGYGFIKFSEFNKSNYCSYIMSSKVKLSKPTDVKQLKANPRVENAKVDLVKSKNGDLEIYFIGELKEIGNYALTISHKICEISDSNVAIGDFSAAKPITIESKDTLHENDADLDCIWLKPPYQVQKDYIWTNTVPLSLKIEASKMNQLKIQRAQTLNLKNLYVQTTVKIYNYGGYNVNLKEIWSPLASVYEIK